jgi:hypothetical protein
MTTSAYAGPLLGRHHLPEPPPSAVCSASQPPLATAAHFPSFRIVSNEINSSRASTTHMYFMRAHGSFTRSPSALDSGVFLILAWFWSKWNKVLEATHDYFCSVHHAPAGYVTKSAMRPVTGMLVGVVAVAPSPIN